MSIDRRVALLIIIVTLALGCIENVEPPSATNGDSGAMSDASSQPDGEHRDSGVVIDGGDGGDGGDTETDWSPSTDAVFPTLGIFDNLEICPAVTLVDNARTNPNLQIGRVQTGGGDELLVAGYRDSSGAWDAKWFRHGDESFTDLTSIPQMADGIGKAAMATIAEHVVIAVVNQSEELVLTRCSFADMPAECETQTFLTDAAIKSVAVAGIVRSFYVYTLEETAGGRDVVERRVDLQDFTLGAPERLGAVGEARTMSSGHLSFGFMNGLPALAALGSVDSMADYYYFFRRVGSEWIAYGLPEPFVEPVTTQQPKVVFDNGSNVAYGAISDADTTRKVRIFLYDGAWDARDGSLLDFVGFDYAPVAGGNVHAYLEPTRLKVNSRVDGSDTTLLDRELSESEYLDPVEVTIVDGLPIIAVRTGLGSLEILPICLL